MLGVEGMVRGLVVGLHVWAGQSDVLVPCGCDCDCSPWAL